MNTLPNCDKLFLRYFDRWYSDDDRQRRGFQATKPDMFTVKELIGAEASDISPLTEKGQKDVLKRIVSMVDAARGDWPEYLPVKGDIDLEWISQFDAYYDRQRIGDLIAHSDPEDFGSDYVVLCCEFGAVIGHVMQAQQPRLLWYYDWPYWESMLLDLKTGTLIPVFHWAIKKMSSYGVEDGYKAKIKMSLDLLEKQAGVKSA